MPATTGRPTLPRVVPFRAPTARLALKPAHSAAEPAEHPAVQPVGLDGAWWPRSRDLTSELTDLADVLDPLWGRITRIAVNPRNWPILPPKILVNGHVVKVGWFTAELDPHQILLLSATSGRWDLLVVPPETNAPAAARLLAAASTTTGPPSTATALITAAGIDATAVSDTAPAPYDTAVPYAVAVAAAQPVRPWRRGLSVAGT
ncbi:hypothetical protein OK074_5355 [Actinobacteria bacterium OK074]|nr:hypothetical protein OK074_5355 [Actinobacteria bacterium OK074]